MRRIENRLVYAPTDLARFLRAPFASWMERLHLERPGAVDPDPEDEILGILADKGYAHEAAVLEARQAAGARVVEIPDDATAAEATRAALARGEAVIYQARLEAGAFAGLADFLERDTRAGEPPLYEVWDAKLARTPKVEHLVQLCAYADLLEQTTGRRPKTLGLELGSGERVSFRTDDFLFHSLWLKEAFLARMAAFDPDDPPLPGPGEDYGRWTSHAEAILEARDHLCRVATIRTSQIRKLEAAGIDTLTALATTRVQRVPKLDAGMFERLRKQAKLQRASAGAKRPRYEVVVPAPEDPRRGLALLPPPSPMDVFFDMEGYPLAEGGLEYLFGATVEEDGSPRFQEFWAFDAAGEKRAFEAFVDWVVERWRRDPTMHVYHYAPYETSALKRLMGTYATREAEIDDLLRGHVFVDLYAVVRQGLLVGEPSYSLKNVERLYLDREGEVATAMDSVLYFERWLASGDPPDWRASKPLAAIRDYNRVDCESTWRLAAWLRERQVEAGLAYLPPPRAKETTEEEPPEGPALERRRLAERMLEAVEGRSDDDVAVRLQRTLAYLLEFHRREDKPVWWSFFERHAMTPDQHVDDPTCIGRATRVGPGAPVRRSMGFSYRFDPDQDTKIHTGSTVYVAGWAEKSLRIEAFDPEGTLTVVAGPTARAMFEGGELPDEASFLLHEQVGAKPIPDSIQTVAEGWMASRDLPAPLGNLLRREPPRLRGHAGGPLLHPDEDPVAGAIRVVNALDGATLCIQGPPGTGKTYVGSHVIAEQVRQGLRVGVVSNSHEAIFNLPGAVNERFQGRLRCMKVGQPREHPFFDACPGARWIGGSGAAAEAYDGGLIGGTAWLFSHAGMAGRLDTLFVDEAGQVSLANLVGMAPSAKNIVLLGDQMQLAQPVQGSHPGESAQSALEYALQGHVTVPPDLGIFLARTWRLHPDLCGFVSGAFYEDRLEPEAHTANRVIRVPTSGGRLVPVEAGLLFSAVEHDGNAQASDEEVERIVAIAEELRGRTKTDASGQPCGKVGIDDILFIAPYNMQVRRLRAALPSGARVASVDKFQGQEAPIVVVSLCASPGESGPRGLGFVLDHNRMNVAVSRAQSLAVVVGDPRLALAPVSTLADLARQNLLCRLIGAGTRS